MNKKLAIFDLDGTLLNTIADLGCACNYALAKHGFPLHSDEEYPHLVGNGINKLIERALPMGHKTTDDIMLIREDFVPYYNLHKCDLTQPYQNIPEAISALKKEDWLLAVASNKYQSAAEEIVNHYFPSMFDLIYGEIGNVPRKPDPTIVDNILNELKVCKSRDTVFYIGDSDVDVLTAKNAALPCVACSWGFCAKTTLQQLTPEYIIDNPQQITEILCNQK